MASVEGGSRERARSQGGGSQEPVKLCAGLVADHDGKTGGGHAKKKKVRVGRNHQQKN